MKIKINKLGIAFFVSIIAAYCLGAAYWQMKSHDYLNCQFTAEITDLDSGCGIEPDGPLGLLLFVLIPLCITILFSLILSIFHFVRKKKV